MKTKITKIITKVGIFLLFFFIFLAGINVAEEEVACTQEAKLCPDGSYVGRIPPNCEFAPCPGSSSSGIITETKGYLHTYDYYSVIYDEEGDAIVAAKLIIQNTRNENLKEINLEIPGFISIYNLVQEVYESYRRPYPYYEYYPYYTGNIFYPIKYEKEQTSSATLLKLRLPKKVGSQNQTTILLLYKIPRATKIDFLGNHEFNFGTIIDKNAMLIQNIRVAVNVQEGLILKGGKANVEYKPDYFANIGAMKISEEGIQSQELSDFSNRITWMRGLVKNAYNLDPFESFHVKGKFSDAIWKLYFVEILGFLAVVIFFVIIIKFFLWKKIKSAVVFPKKVLKKEGEIEESYGQIFIRAIIFGFISAILISITWFLLILIGGWLSTLPYYYGYGFNIMLMPLFILIGIIIMIISLFTPSIYIGTRYGILEGLLTFIMTAVWLFIFLVAFIVIVGFLFNQATIQPMATIMERSTAVID